MNYIVVTNEWLSEHGILPLPTMRKSKDGSKIIMHEDYLTPFIEASKTIEETPEGETIVKEMNVPTYAHNSQQLKDILESEEWAYNENEGSENTSDFIQLAAVRNLKTATKANIQNYSITDNEALSLTDMYPAFDEVIGKPLAAGFKLQDGGKLYKVIQAHTAQADWKPSETPALYGLVIENHAGTLEDPIPYERMMVLEQGKYYTQFGVTYKCVTGSGVGYDADLTELLALLEKVEEEKQFNL